MDAITYRSGQAYCEALPLRELAEKYGTPLYVYSGAALDARCDALKAAFAGHPTLPCYAVKANTNLSLLKRIAGHGFGADVVSVGELEKALLAGIPASQIVYSGVGKLRSEIERALDVGILSFNVESVGELTLISEVAQKKQKRAPVTLRINPNVDAKTNPYIATGLYSTKFGIAENEMTWFLEIASNNRWLDLVGLSCHIGSQITDLNPFREVAERMATLSREIQAKGFALRLLDLGGGLGIRYHNENLPGFEDYARTLIPAAQAAGVRLLIEPGRSVVGNTGVLLSQVLYVKRTPAKTFVIVDAAMNDLLRPSIYRSYHQIRAVKGDGVSRMENVDVVGPICETGDFLGLDRTLPELKPGDHVFVEGAGAYGFAMASNYNTRPRACEILVDKDHARVVRKRETLEQLLAPELVD
ncbi:MAG: diaminopimelate decarboxylase [Bdellovibrionales bacterium]|nr:diaminopimelate decarboxylase [Bdellovibrionales bacterium]